MNQTRPRARERRYQLTLSVTFLFFWINRFDGSLWWSSMPGGSLGDSKPLDRALSSTRSLGLAALECAAYRVVRPVREQGLVRPWQAVAHILISLNPCGSTFLAVRRLALLSPTFIPSLLHPGPVALEHQTRPTRSRSLRVCPRSVTWGGCASSAPRTSMAVLLAMPLARWLRNDGLA